MPSDAQTSPAEIGQQARSAAVDAAWRQWAALGASAQTPARSGSTIDPEALVLASSLPVEHERRLADFLLWWADTGAPLLSVQRTRSLLRAMPRAADEAPSYPGISRNDQSGEALAEGQAAGAATQTAAAAPGFSFDGE